MSGQEMSSRLAALGDAEGILQAAYTAPCGPDWHFVPCPKCGLLERVMNRVGEWYDDETQAAREAATRRHDLERAALTKLIEWRKVRAEYEAAKLARWKHIVETKPGKPPETFEAMVRERRALDTLSVAADALQAKEAGRG